MSSREFDDLTDIFRALSHPLRQDIILILAEYQRIGFTALQKELNQSQSSKKPIQVGSIYHHISLLGDLVHQDTGTKYWFLSERGWYAYGLLTSNQDKDSFLKKGDLEQKTLFSYIWRVLAPPELFLQAKKSLVLFLGWEIIFIVAFAFITAQTGLVLVFIFFSPTNPDKDMVISLVSIVITWFVYSALVLLLSSQLLKNRKIKLKDAATITIFLGIALLPLAVFPVLLWLGLFTLEQQYIPLGIATVLQLWVILLSARSISVHFFARMERAGIICLIAIYIMVLLGLILGF